MASSAACTSSRKTTPGCGAAARPRREPRRRPRAAAPGARAPRAAPGPAAPARSVRQLGQEQRGIGEALGGNARHASRSPIRAAPRSSSTIGPYGRPASSSWQCAASTAPPASRTLAASSSRRRVLPIPASPSTTARRPSGAAARWPRAATRARRRAPRAAAPAAAAGQRRRSPEAARERRERPLAHSARTAPCLLQRSDAQLLAQGAHAGAVLRERGAAVAAARA